MLDRIRTEPTPCPLCRSEQGAVWGRENGFTALKCASCGLVYVSPRPAMDEISEAQTIGEHRTQEGVLNLAGKRRQSKVRFYRDIIAEMYRDEIRAGKPIRWLDVGAGYGELVEALARALPSGSQAKGIEPMREKVRLARDRGIDMTTEGLSEIKETFDVISIINVFSHLPDPDDFLHTIGEKVRPGGSVFLQSGNGGDLESVAEYPDMLFLPAHLVFGGIEHVKLFLDRSGFDVAAIRQRHRDVPSWVLKNAVKKLLGRPSARLALPYTSRFRNVFFKAVKR